MKRNAIHTTTKIAIDTTALGGIIMNATEATKIAWQQNMDQNKNQMGMEAMTDRIKLNCVDVYNLFIVFIYFWQDCFSSSCCCCCCCCHCSFVFSRGTLIFCVMSRIKSTLQLKCRSSGCVLCVYRLSLCDSVMNSLTDNLYQKYQINFY